MNKNYNIEEAKINDATGLSDCMISAYNTYLDRMNGKKLPPMEVDYLEEIKNYPTWVVKDDNKIIGGLIMVFENEYASIANISVAPDFQRKGIGGLLMSFAEKNAKNRGYSKLQLATHVLLTENIEIYKHLGWIEVDRDLNRVYFQKSI